MTIQEAITTPLSDEEIAKRDDEILQSITSFHMTIREAAKKHTLLPEQVHRILTKNGIVSLRDQKKLRKEALDQFFSTLDTEALTCKEARTQAHAALPAIPKIDVSRYIKDNSSLFYHKPPPPPRGATRTPRQSAIRELDIDASILFLYALAHDLKPNYESAVDISPHLLQNYTPMIRRKIKTLVRAAMNHHDGAKELSIKKAKEVRKTWTLDHDIKPYSREFPIAVSSIVSRKGSWSKALNDVGLTSPRAPGTGRTQKFSDSYIAELSSRFQLWAVLQGLKPSSKNYMFYEKEVPHALPSRSTIRAKAGSWALWLKQGKASPKKSTESSSKDSESLTTADTDTHDDTDTHVDTDTHDDSSVHETVHRVLSTWKKRIFK